MLYLAMNFYSQSLYKSLQSALDDNRQKKSNLLILTLPGLGISYFLKSYLEKKKDKSIAYISSPNQKLNKYNILDLGFIQNSQSLSVADEYFKSANIDEKFVLVINDPSIISSPDYKSSYLSRHLYQTFYFTARNFADTKIFALEINPDLTDSQIKHIYEVSGGIGKLIKFLCINPQAPDFPQDLINPITNSISQCDSETLKKFNIDPKKIPFLKSLPSKLNIKINFDLSFEEDNIKSKEILTKEERDILNFMLQNNNEIPREKVADFKWGEGKYDKFSDQAINKSMRRLSEKLSKFEITTIPKIGYQINYK